MTSSSRFAQAIFGTLFNLHLLEIGYTANHIGILQSLSALLIAAIAMPIGLAGDRWGRRGPYVTASILFSVPYLIMPWLTSYPLLLGFFILGTVGNALMWVNKSPVLAGELDSDQRASVFSFMMINCFMWNTLGIQLAGFLANWLPAGSLSKYDWALAVAGINGIASGLIRAFLPFRQQVPARHRVSVDKPPGGPERGYCLLAARRRRASKPVRFSQIRYDSTTSHWGIMGVGGRRYRSG